MMRRFRQFPTIGGRRGGIPADCVLVQYLRSTGTQYIDTGIVATPTTGAYWKVKCNTYNDGCLGMYQSSIDMLYIDFYGNGIYFRYGKYASSKITSGFDASGVNEMECKDGSCHLNGESVYDGANTSSIGSDSRTLYIFARNHRGSAAGYALVDLYAHKIYDGSDLVADFVPVRRVESGVSVGYMCDRLTGQLYGNQGTGAFVLGPDKQTEQEIEEMYKEFWEEYLTSSITEFDTTNLSVSTPTSFNGGISTIGGGVLFRYSSTIRKVKMPQFLVKASYFFNGCNALTDVTFYGVSNSAYIFATCNNLANLTLLGMTRAEILAMPNTLSSLPTTCVIHCTDGDVSYNGSAWA